MTIHTGYTSEEERFEGIKHELQNVIDICSIALNTLKNGFRHPEDLLQTRFDIQQAIRKLNTGLWDYTVQKEHLEENLAQVETHLEEALAAFREQFAEEIKNLEENIPKLVGLLIDITRFSSAAIQETEIFQDVSEKAESHFSMTRSWGNLLAIYRNTQRNDRHDYRGTGSSLEISLYLLKRKLDKS